VLGAWLRDLLRLTSGNDASAAGSLAAMRGCGLPPLSDPFWRRSDLATQVLTVLSTLERERALLVAQLHSLKSGLPSSSTPQLTPAQIRHQSSLAAAAARGAPITVRAAGAGGAAGAAADKAAAEKAAALERALDAEQVRAREREAKLQAEIDAVMMAGIEALEAKNAFNAEADRLQKQARVGGREGGSARARMHRETTAGENAACFGAGWGVPRGRGARARRAAPHAARRAARAAARERARRHARAAATPQCCAVPSHTHTHTHMHSRRLLFRSHKRASAFLSSAAPFPRCWSCRRSWRSRRRTTRSWSRSCARSCWRRRSFRCRPFRRRCERGAKGRKGRKGGKGGKGGRTPPAERPPPRRGTARRWPACRCAKQPLFWWAICATRARAR
jgi:hypothetical protein